MSRQKPSHTRGLSDQQLRWLAAFIGPAKGNATLAAKMANYSLKTAKQQGSRLLTSVAVARAIATFQRTRDRRSIADAKERDEILSAILRDETADAFARIAAAKELNRCSGRHSVKHQIDVSKTLADIIAGSRLPARLPEAAHTDELHGRDVGDELSGAAAQAAERAVQ